MGESSATRSGMVPGMRPLVLGLTACVVVALAASCASNERVDGSSDARSADHESHALHNLHRFGDGVYSGSVPHGEAGFDELRAMGVRTVISVDAARPDVEATRARGMRYIQIPIQYAGISSAERLALTKALREAERPIYVHCHHGKHRGPAAAAYALATCGEITPERGVELLEISGTSKSYPGLWEVVGNADAPSPEQERVMASVELPEIAQVTGFAAGMAGVDRAWDHLKLMAKNGWRAPSDHPDLVAAAEAGVVADHLRTLIDDEESVAYGEAFQNDMARSAREASELEAALVDRDLSLADVRFEALGASCNACHDTHRNDVGVE